MLELIAYLIMLLAQQSAVAETPPTIYHAASVAAGEAPISLVGEAGYLGVLWTMRCRLDSDRYPNDLPGILRDYYAPPREPTEQEAFLASAVLLQPHACRDAPDPYFYAMSEQDVTAHSWPPGDIIAGEGTYRIHFYTVHPSAP